MIRKVITLVEETYVEGGKDVDHPTRLAVSAAVISNPFAGRFVENLDPLKDEYAKVLAAALVERASQALKIGGGDNAVACFGKAFVVGMRGEIEHGAAIVHTMEFGGTVRDLLGGGAAMIPSVDKRGPAGSTLDVPLKNRHDASMIGYHQALEIRIPDAPGPDEIVIALGLSDGPRPHARLGPRE